MGSVMENRLSLVMAAVLFGWLPGAYAQTQAVSDVVAAGLLTTIVADISTIKSVTFTSDDSLNEIKVLLDSGGIIATILSDISGNVDELEPILNGIDSELLDQGGTLDNILFALQNLDVSSGTTGVQNVRIVGDFPLLVTIDDVVQIDGNVSLNGPIELDGPIDVNFGSEEDFAEVEPELLTVASNEAVIATNEMAVYIAQQQMVTNKFTEVCDMAIACATNFLVLKLPTIGSESVIAAGDMFTFIPSVTIDLAEIDEWIDVIRPVLLYFLRFVVVFIGFGFVRDALAS